MCYTACFQAATISPCGHRGLANWCHQRKDVPWLPLHLVYCLLVCRHTEGKVNRNDCPRLHKIKLLSLQETYRNQHVTRLFEEYSHGFTVMSTSDQFRCEHLVANININRWYNIQPFLPMQTSSKTMSHCLYTSCCFWLVCHMKYISMSLPV